MTNKASDDAVVVDHLRVVRGGREVLPDLEPLGAPGPGRRAARAERRRQVDPDAGRRRGAGHRRWHGHRARRGGRRRPGCGTGSATSPRRRASTATSRCATTSATSRRIMGVGADAVDRAIAAVDLTDHAHVKVENLSGGQQSRAQPRLHAGRGPRGARARRADRRARPGAAARPVGPVPPAGRRGAHGVRVEPRHGRGLALRPAAAAARRPHPQRLHPARAARAHRHRGCRAGLPRAHRRGGRATARHAMEAGGAHERPDHRAPPRPASCASCAPTTARSP